MSETVDEEIKLIAHSKRVREGEILAESELDKWTSEGLVKRNFLSIQYRKTSVIIGQECDGIL